MLSVLRVHLPSDIPIAGCELCPYVLLRKPDGSITTDDIPETNPVNGFYLRCRWYRVQGDKRHPVCSVHVSELAVLQCIGCLKAKLPVAKSYHCSPMCFQQCWPRHKAWHARGTIEGRESTEEEELFGRVSGSSSTATAAGGGGVAGNGVAGGVSGPVAGFGPGGVVGTGAGYGSSGGGSGGGGSGSANGWVPGGASNSSAGGNRGRSTPPPLSQDGGGGGGVGGGGGGPEAWIEVGRGRTYTPTADDVGYVLKLECCPVDVATGQVVAPPSTILTSRVIPAPSPTPRRMIPLGDMAADAAAAAAGGQPLPAGMGMGAMGGMGLGMAGIAGGMGGPSAAGIGGKFSLLTYNVLADLYATSEMYGYCPPWALSWAYRKQNLLRELLGYRADIMCLQEVQSDHYEEFFGPELDKQGYASVYKKKTVEVYTGTAYAIDGCATFYRRDKFSLVKKYEVEFNKAALSLSEALAPPTKKAALNRLIKDNVALIVVLEARDANADGHRDGPTPPPAKRQLLCVANTHIHANPELKDVKLWQVHTLLKGLEKIAASADIPMLVAGDFNSVPGSAPHSLLASGRVDANHPELATDPLGILRPASKLCHALPLVSAYAVLGRNPADRATPQQLQQQRRLDSASREPLFTNCTRDFLGTLDYIFFTADSLSVESLLELLDEDAVRKDTALPSPEWSSDHLALLAEFRYKPKPPRR